MVAEWLHINKDAKCIYYDVIGCELQWYELLKNGEVDHGELNQEKRDKMTFLFVKQGCSLIIHTGK